MRRVNASHPFFTASALLLVILIFMFFVQLAELDSDKDAVIYGVMLLLEIVVFAVPAGAFCYFKGAQYIFSLNIYAPRKNTVSVIFLGAAVVILASAVMKFGIFNFVYKYSLYGSSITLKASSWWAGLLMVLSLAVLPSIVEEFVFRGIMLREYRNGGIWFAALISSIMFAMIHFDLKQFPIYLALGMILAWIEFITKSVWACVAVHIIYNIYAIFIEKYIWIFSTNPDSEVLFWLILVCALFICAFFFLSSAEKVMRLCVDVGERAPSVPKISARRVFMFDAVTEKPFLIACAVFAVISLINLIIK